MPARWLVGSLVTWWVFGALLAGPSLAQRPADERLPVDVAEGVEVPMRDGTILRAVVTQPTTGGPYPVLMLRTPYGVSPSAAYRQLAGHGYIVVAQDTRGRHASDGIYEPMCAEHVHEAEDGYDTVAWCAKLPNSTGQVGTFGTSYPAFTQWRTASLAPPSLVAMAAFSIPARHTRLEGPGSIRAARRIQWWYGTISSDLRRRAGRPGPHTKAEAAKLYPRKHDELIWTLPWSELPDEVFEDQKDAILAYFRNPQYDMWRLDEGAAQATAPNLNVCGWYDHCNSIDMHLAIARHGKTESARNNSRLIVGPWAHHALGKRKTGEFDFGPEAVVDLQQLQLDWFNYWLKGQETGILDTAPVRIFVMGSNRWRDEPTWPLERAVERRLYLAGNGRANTPQGDGQLSDAPRAAAAVDHYTYDPADPVPSLFDPNGFAICADQNRNADRQDILVYQTEPLTEPLEVIGEPVLELHAASSAPDTDWIVKLVDAAPDGRARDVSTGILRARYREGFQREVFLTPGEVVKYTIRMNPTAVEFQPGHRIRVDITSSDFPSFDRNHNTAVNQNFDAELQIAEQQVFHGHPTPSAIVLPVIAE